MLTVLVLVAGLVGLATMVILTDPSTVLNSLALAQASILAIIFSVTILGFQLVANRYSPGMTSLITGDRIFKGTFWLLVISGGYDLLMVYLFPGLPESIGAGLMAGGVLLGSFLIIILWRYVNTVLSRSTPEGLLDAYAAQMTPLASWAQYQQTSESETGRHPFHDLFETTMAALTNQEWLTAIKGLETMEEVTNKVIPSLSERGQVRMRLSVNRAVKGSISTHFDYLYNYICMQHIADTSLPKSLNKLLIRAE